MDEETEYLLQQLEQVSVDMQKIRSTQSLRSSKKAGLGDVPQGTNVVVVQVGQQGNRGLLYAFGLLAVLLGLGVGIVGPATIVEEIRKWLPGATEDIADGVCGGPKVPCGNPLFDERVIMTQGYGTGSHAPAAIWGAIDLAIDGDGDGYADSDGSWGAPIYASHSGTVAVAPNTYPAGNHVWIRNDEYRTGYAHLEEFAVETGQEVKRGDLIGYMGSTGMSSGPHLDYQVWKMVDGAWVNQNPLDYRAMETLKKSKGTTGGEPESSDIEVVIADGLPSYQGQRDAIVADTLEAYEYVSGRFKTSLTSQTRVIYQGDVQCGLHGLAFTDRRDLYTFTCESIPYGRAVAIMAHEIVHQLQQDRYGAAHSGADLALSEGSATWAAGRYWLGGNEDFRSKVRSQRAAGQTFPMDQSPYGMDHSVMNVAYYQWASFVDFLIVKYGHDKFDEVYVSGGGGAPGSANYQAVYGKSFAQLVADWEVWLEE